MILRFETFVSLFIMLLQALLTPRMTLAQTDPSDVEIYYQNSDIPDLDTPRLMCKMGGTLNVCADGAWCLTVKWTRPNDTHQDQNNWTVGTQMAGLNVDTSAVSWGNNSGIGDSSVGTLWCGLQHFNTIDSAIYQYTNPSVLPPPGSLFRTVYLQFHVVRMTDVGNQWSATEYVAFVIPVHVYRVPVVMVHGVLADRTTFTTMRDAMLANGWPSMTSSGNYGYGPLLWAVDYSATNARSFSTNSNVVPNAISLEIRRAVYSGYAAVKVDIVAHSMGGILSIPSYQSLLQGENLYGDIHKLITLNSPLAGSQLANLLCDPNQNVTQATNTIRLIYNLLSYKTLGDAMNDLCVNSLAITELRAFAMATEGFPKHAIITSAGNLWDNDWDGVFWSVAGKILQIDAWSLYHEDNDLVVAYSSQAGGLTGLNISVISPQVHVGSASNPYVINTVISLLNRSAKDPAFTTDAFNPPQLTYNSPSFNIKQNPDGPLRIAQSQIAITSPKKGTVVSAGSTVNVSMSGSIDINSILFIAGKPSAGIYIDSLKSNSGTVSYKVPSNVVGPLTLVAAGFSGNTFVAYDSLKLLVSTSAILDSMMAEPAVAYLNAGDSMSITITGKYNDEVDRDISADPQLILASKNNGIAKVLQSNLVRGIDSGTTTVTVSYSGKNTSVTIIVLPSSVTGVGNGRGPQSRLGDLPSAFVLDQNYPNPFNPTTVISYQLPTNCLVMLMVYDVLGREVETLVNEREDVGSHSVTFDASKLPSGVYFYRLQAGTYNDTKKLLLLK